MATTQDVRKVAMALVRGVNDHGAPSSFAPGELEVYGAPAPLVTGQVQREWNAVLAEELTKHGLRYQYRGRRFHITEH